MPPAAQDPALALAALDRKIADLDASEQSDKIEIGHVGTQLGDARAKVLSRGRAFYKLTRAGLLPVGGGFDSLVTLRDARRAHAAAARAGPGRRGAAAGARRGPRGRHRAHRARSGRVRGAADRASRQRASRWSKSRGGRRRSTARSRRRPARPPTTWRSTARDPDSPGDGFAAARGRLVFPVAGRADVRPARRVGTDGPGLEIHAPAGSPVRAVFAGHVAFADRYGPYGRIVILDHGAHYYTVSGNLDEIDVKIGQDVGAGERVGTVGDDGPGPMLYFEVRHGSQTVSPSAWLGL